MTLYEFRCAVVGASLRVPRETRERVLDLLEREG